MAPEVVSAAPCRREAAIAYVTLGGEVLMLIASYRTGALPSLSRFTPSNTPRTIKTRCTRCWKGYCSVQQVVLS